MARLNRTIVLTMALLGTACATAKPSATAFVPVVSPGTRYLATAPTNDGSLEVEMMFSEGGAVFIAGNVDCGVMATGEEVFINGRVYRYGQLPPYMIRRIGDTIRLDCPATRIVLERSSSGSLRGTVSSLEEQKETRQGPCEEWEKDPRTGRNLRCIRWAMIEVVVRSAWGAELPLFLSARDDAAAAREAADAGPASSRLNRRL
jgi:hypothetical protein